MEIFSMEKLDKIRIIKWTIVSIATILYVIFSLDTGIWLTGDMHNGGPFIGLLVTPVFTLIVILLLFQKERKTKNISIIILSTLILFFIYYFVLTILINSLFIKIFKEYYLMNEYSIWIKLTKWVMVTFMTITSYLIVKKIKKN